jgi:putative flippase GtrA
MSAAFLRFLLVGVINTCVGLGIMLGLLNIAGLDYWTSTFIGNSLGAVVSYVLNRSYTFRSDVHWWRGIMLFAIVILACYLAAYGIGMALVERLLPLLMPQAGRAWIDNIAVFAGMGMYTLLNYAGQKRFVFGGGGSGRPADPPVGGRTGGRSAGRMDGVSCRRTDEE